MSHTLSASVDDNFASMSTINVLIRCKQLSLSGQYIPYQTMTDQQLLYYCAVQFDSPFPSISQDYSPQFLFLEHCLQIARPTAHTLLPQYLRFTIEHAWRLIMPESDLPVQLPDYIRSTALQVFTHMEREHDLRPIPFPSRFLRACLYFHPAITGPKYHLAYFRSLNLAFEILKSANSVLQLNSIENEPDTTSSGNSKNANDSPKHDGSASFDPDGSSDSTDNNQADTTFSLTLSSSRGQHAWSDKTMAEVIQLCAHYRRQGLSIPVTLMTSEQFSSYCVSRTRTDCASIRSSFHEIRNLVQAYDLQSLTVPDYLVFTVTVGTRLLASSKSGVYDKWPYHHSALQISQRVFALAIRAEGTAVGITPDIPNDQQYQKLSPKFTPDQLLPIYHGVYQPFLINAYKVLTVASELIRRVDRTNLHDTESASDTESDNDYALSTHDDALETADANILSGFTESSGTDKRPDQSNLASLAPSTQSLQEQNAIPVQHMTDKQFLQRCASITNTNTTLALSSLAQITVLLNQYQPESAGLPDYLLFAITVGTHLLRTNTHGGYDEWKLRRTPLGLAKNVIKLCVGSLGTELGITENTPIKKCYAQLKQHFHADKLLSEYHPAYHPFLRQAPHVLTVAYTLLETDPDMPALETDSDDGYSVEPTLVQQQPVARQPLTAAHVISPDSTAVG